PVALLPVISKVLEKVIYNGLITLVREKIFERQFRFLPSRSMMQQMLIMLETTYNALDNKNSVNCVYMDFRKAFDSVCHSKLLQKLWQFGIVGDMWKWFNTYLTTRRQCVKVNNSTSSFLNVLSGVP
uniref:Reverse transcriptase domain-containing protein n=1 Tax=Amphimedon queenslandica TaxID=400682 RepID=A0A1X7U5Q7_AMPQE